MKNLNRALFEAGIFVIRDDPQGKRRGRRGPDGRIIEAYGFDLSPLAMRHEEFIRIAAAAKSERELMTRLRRRRTLAARSIRQAIEELSVQGYDDEALRQLARDTADLTAAARQAERSDDLALAVQALERRKLQAEQWLREMIKTVETDPEGLTGEPLQYTTTTLIQHPIKDTVAAFAGSSRGEARPSTCAPSPADADRLFSERMDLHPAQLADLAPRLEPYLTRGKPLRWPEIIDAAGWLSGELNISHTLWGRPASS